MLAKTFVAILASLQITSVLAKNCQNKTFGSCSDGITHSYDADDGQICDPIDCGGGRAPPKTNEPCCAAYTGTAQCVAKTSYLSCFSQLAASTAAPSSSSREVGMVGAPVRITSAPSSSANSNQQQQDQAQQTSDVVYVTASGSSNAQSTGAAHTTSKTGTTAKTTGTSTITRATTGTAGLFSATTSSATATPTGAANGVQAGSFFALAAGALGLMML